MSTEIGVSINTITVDPNLTELEKMVEKFWSVEDIGCRFSEKREHSIEDRRTLNILNEKTRHDENCYEVPMLWRTDSPQLEDNRKQAETQSH